MTPNSSYVAHMHFRGHATVRAPCECCSGILCSILKRHPKRWRCTRAWSYSGCTTARRVSATYCWPRQHAISSQPRHCAPFLVVNVTVSSAACQNLSPQELHQPLESRVHIAMEGHVVRVTRRSAQAVLGYPAHMQSALGCNRPPCRFLEYSADVRSLRGVLLLAQ